MPQKKGFYAPLKVFCCIFDAFFLSRMSLFPDKLLLDILQHIAWLLLLVGTETEAGKNRFIQR